MRWFVDYNVGLLGYLRSNDVMYYRYIFQGRRTKNE